VRYAIIFIIAFILVQCNVKTPQSEGEVLYLHRSVQHFADNKRVLEIRVTEYPFKSKTKLLNYKY